MLDVMVRTLAGVPVVLRPPEPPQGDERAPLLLLWHGFGPPANEHALAKTLPLLSVPAWRAYLGLPHLGSRLPEGGVDELLRRQRDDWLLNLFLPIVDEAVHELPRFISALRQELGLAHNSPLGIFGFSAGGTAALLALAESQEQFAAAAAYNPATDVSANMASYEKSVGPYTWTESSRAAAQRLDLAARAPAIARGKQPPALLLLAGAHDETVPPEHSARLYTVLQPYYETEDRLSLDIIPELHHHIGPIPNEPFPLPVTDANPVEQRLIIWFQRYLTSRSLEEC